MRTRLLTKKRLLVGVTALLLASAGTPLFFSEIRSFLLFQLAPGYARDAHFLRLRKGDQVVYLLGTVHTDHLASRDYSLWHLGAVVDRLRPDLLLVESRPEELARDNWGDGPVEMPFASLTARAGGIPVEGIDWWERAGSRPGTSNPGREERMFRNLTERLPGRGTALVLVGYSHVAELSERLQETGYTADRFERSEKQALFATADRPPLFPPRLGHYLRKNVDARCKELEQETDPACRSAIRANIAVREEFIRLIDRTGERPARDPEPAATEGSKGKG